MTTAQDNERLLPSAGGFAVRMYRQGLGDCFLLAFATADPEIPCYVLIDCGVHRRQDQGVERLAEVMENLVAATNGKIDVVVATHEHADHLSGFVQRGSPFLTGHLKLDSLWLAWTEKRGDPQADALRRRRGAAREAIQRAAEKLNRTAKRAAGKLNKTALMDQCKQLEGLMDFEEIVDGSGLSAARKAAKGKGPRTKPSSNEVALQILTEKVGPDNVHYCEPKEQALSLPGAHGLCAYVLGPPRDERLLKKDLPTGEADDPRHETYLAGRTSHLAFMLAPGLAEGSSATDASGPVDDFRHPFDHSHRIDYPRLATPRLTPGRTPLPESREHFLRYANYFEDQRWRQIETAWLGAAELLALDLDGDTNNTSLVLAFEVGPAGRGDVLLFVGDAQVGNWLSWRKQTYRAPGGSVQTADDLLGRTILYKVGHHGSHNGTVKVDPSDTSAAQPRGKPFGLELMPSRLIALVPVDRAAAQKPMPRPWHMPHPPLYRRLLEKAAGRVLRSDGLAPEAEAGDLEVHVPKGQARVKVPGLPKCHWRESPRSFQNGEPCALYYDIAFD